MTDDLEAPRGRSRWTLLAVLAVGMLIGRFVSQLGPTALQAFDMLSYAVLALAVTAVWRAWARRAMVARRREQQRRQRRPSPPREGERG